MGIEPTWTCLSGRCLNQSSLLPKKSGGPMIVYFEHGLVQGAVPSRGGLFVWAVLQDGFYPEHRAREREDLK